MDESALQSGDQSRDFRTLVKDANQEIRLGFVRKVYGILSTQLLLTVAIAAPISRMDQHWVQSNSWLLMVAVGMTFATMCAMACCQDVARRYPTNYLCLFTFTAFEGVVLGFLSAQYTWQSAALSAGITCGVFVAMTAFACLSKRDFTGYGPYLFGLMAAMCMFGMAMWILSMCGVGLPKGMMMLYDLMGIVLFTFYIVYDTQMVLGEYGGHKQQFSIDDYVFAALNLYLDIVNLFIYMLRLVGDRR